MNRFVVLCALLLVGCSEYGLAPGGPDADLRSDDPSDSVDDATDELDDDPAGDLGDDLSGTDDPAPDDPAPDDPTLDDPNDPLEDPEDPIEDPDPVATDYSQSWDLPVDQPVDVMLFADTSGSMSDELEGVGDNLELFTNRLVAEGVDWHLMAVNGDHGCGVDGWFDANTPNWQTRFPAALLVEPDDYDEAGLMTSANAVENTCNSGFMRPGALLHIIYISDEEDQSDGDGTPGYHQQYVDRIVAAKGDASLVTLSAVAGPAPGGCHGADPGFGYDAAVSGTNSGEFLSICDDWAGQLDTLAAAAVIQDSFVLDSTADPLTIQVTINGTPVPWSDFLFDTASNTIIFVANGPQPGDAVQIGYSAP